MLTSGSERRFELTKLVVDKLLFGPIVLSLGLLGKFWLDSRQAEADLRRALALTRATRLGEVWEKAYQLEAALESMPTKQRVVEHRREALDALRDSMMLAGLDAETADDSAATLLQHRPDLEAMGWLRFESILSELNDLIDQNRFWLGEDSYRNIGEYINLNHELMYEHSFGSGAPTPPWIARLDSLRSDIQKVSSSLLR